MFAGPWLLLAPRKKKLKKLNYYQSYSSLPIHLPSLQCLKACGPSKENKLNGVPRIVFQSTKAGRQDLMHMIAL